MKGKEGLDHRFTAGGHRSSDVGRRTCIVPQSIIVRPVLSASPFGVRVLFSLSRLRFRCSISFIRARIALLVS